MLRYRLRRDRLSCLTFIHLPLLIVVSSVWSPSAIDHDIEVGAIGSASSRNARKTRDVVFFQDSFKLRRHGADVHRGRVSKNQHKAVKQTAAARRRRRRQSTSRHRVALPELSITMRRARAAGPFWGDLAKLEKKRRDAVAFQDYTKAQEAKDAIDALWRQASAHRTNKAMAAKCYNLNQKATTLGAWAEDLRLKKDILTKKWEERKKEVGKSCGKKWEEIKKEVGKTCGKMNISVEAIKMEEQ